MKARIAAVSLVAALLAIVVRALPAAALEPHENPETAPLVFDGVAVLQKYSQALDYVMAENTSAMEQLQEQAVPANIPQELRNTVDSFLSSSNSLAGQLPLLKADIENAKTMLAQYRVEDARQSFPEIQARLSQAYSQLLVMDNAAADTGRWWNADAARPGTALRVAYDDVQTKLQGLRQFLDLLDNMNLSLTRQTEAILAITEGDLAKVEELKGLLAQEKASPEALAKVEELKGLLTQEKASPEALAKVEELKELLTQEKASPEALAKVDELKGLLLRPTTLTLSIEPGTAFVGDKITFRGTFGSEGKPLSGRIVTVLLDNAPVSSVLTNSDGTYQDDILLPYRYVPEMKAQALFYPVGNDIGQYLGASSPLVTIKTLFYKSGLNVVQGTPANPGRDFLVQGAFNYGNDTALPERPLNVYLDNNLIFDGSVGTGFYLRLPVSANTSIGIHQLTFDAPASGRYAPARSNLDIEVSRIVPGVELNTPGIILLPFSPQIRGNVRSAIGPLPNTAVEITLGSWKTAARTGADGSFSARLDTGWSLTFLGAQDLRVTVTPTEPWYQSASKTVSVLVVNPANIAGILIILIVLAVSGTRRLGRKASRPFGFIERPVPELGPIMIKPENIPAPPPAAVPGDPRSILLSLYRGVFRFVQHITGMIPPPQQTLREFAAENEPKLGPIGGYFREFTLMIERLLYSRHDFDERDVAHARELSGKVQKGAGNEDS